MLLLHTLKKNACGTECGLAGFPCLAITDNAELGRVVAAVNFGNYSLACRQLQQKCQGHYANQGKRLGVASPLAEEHPTDPGYRQRRTLLMRLAEAALPAIDAPVQPCTSSLAEPVVVNGVWWWRWLPDSTLRVELQRRWLSQSRRWNGLPRSAIRSCLVKSHFVGGALTALLPKITFWVFAGGADRSWLPVQLRIPG